MEVQDGPRSDSSDDQTLTNASADTLLTVIDIFSLGLIDRQPTANANQCSGTDLNGRTAAPCCLCCVDDNDAMDDPPACWVHHPAFQRPASVHRVTGVWQQYLGASMLVAIRVSGLMIFAPVFSSGAIAPRIKAGFVCAMTILLAPVLAALPDGRAEVGVGAILGELAVGLVFGLCLMMLTEALLFAGALLGISFSFSLVNLLDPNTMVETPIFGQLLGWLGTLVILGAGLDRVLLAAVLRSFVVIPPGQAALRAKTGFAIAAMAGGIFIAGLQLAAPVMAAGLVVEITVSLVSRLAPQLPAQVVGIPLKTLGSYVVLIASLAVWPGWIEHHFLVLLDTAEGLMVRR